LIQSKYDVEELERDYKHFFDQSYFGVTLFDSNGIIIEINSTLEKLIGYTREELVLKNIIDFPLYPKEHIPILQDRFQGILDGEIQTPIELKISNKEGKSFWVHATTIPVKHGNSTLLLSIIEDINERKILEERLKESEDKFKIFNEQSLIGVAIFQDNVFKYCNKRFSQILDYSCEEILNWEPGEFLKVIHPDDREFVVEQAQKKQTGAEDAIVNYVIRGFKKNGDSIWAENFSNTIQYRGRPGVLNTLLDITEKKKAEEHLKKLLRVKKDFINRASHEIKNPLTSISSAAQLLKMSHKDELSTQALELVNMILKGSKRIDNIIHDLLDTTKIESDKLKLKKKPVDIGSLVIGCIEESQLFINERNLKLSSEIDPQVNLNVDKSKIEQVCSNLLSNAIKNTPPGGEIKVKLRRENEHIEFSILDTGVGLKEDDISKLFKQFSRIDRSDVTSNIITEGTGLGLFISKEIVEMHNGQILVESEGRNKGSKFTVQLPIK